jgi:outer membrane lipoprotein-sorting protein
LADFLLRKDFKLRDDLTVTQVTRSRGLLQMTIKQTAEPGAGSLMLGLKETPALELKKWRVVDAQGMITEIELFDIEKNVKFPSQTFVYRDPAPKGFN